MSVRTMLNPMLTPGVGTNRGILAFENVAHGRLPRTSGRRELSGPLIALITLATIHADAPESLLVSHHARSMALSQ